MTVQGDMVSWGIVAVWPLHLKWRRPQQTIRRKNAPHYSWLHSCRNGRTTSSVVSANTADEQNNAVHKNSKRPFFTAALVAGLPRFPTFKNEFILANDRARAI
jgi:hypothetical protein